jgi:hypothetical protein
MQKYIEIVSNYLNKHQIVTLVIITILVIILIIIIVMPNKNENFVNTENKKIMSEHVSSETMDTFNLNKKMVNFECSVDGQTYYLANVPITQCTNKSNLPVDCYTTAVLLINEQDILNSLKTYNSVTDEDDNKCFKTTNNKFCKTKKQYIHDFTLQSVKQNTYLIRGTSIPATHVRSYPTIINQQLYQNNGYNSICADNTNYIEKKVNKKFYDITFEKINNLYIMKMESDDVIPNKNHEAIRFSDHGKIRFKPTYVGIDRTNNCMYNGKMYPRLKLYNNKNDKDILQFKITNIR